MEYLNVDIILIVALLVAAAWTVLTSRLLRSVIGLAIVSVLLTIIMYRLASPIAAVFELSVCAGLVSAVFLSVIGLTIQRTALQEEERSKERLRRYWRLPILMILVGIVLSQIHLPLDIVTQKTSPDDAKQVLWNLRHLDLLGQITVLLGGALGVVILFKEWKRER